MEMLCCEVKLSFQSARGPEKKVPPAATKIISDEQVMDNTYLVVCATASSNGQTTVVLS